MITYAKASAIEGGLAQLARAFDWQSRGHRFDSDILHTGNQVVTLLKGVATFFMHKQF